MKNVAIILAAGVGSRLLPITNLMPKSLVKVAGRPILDYQIQGYLNAGLAERDIYIVTGYMSNEIKSYLYSHYPFVNVVESINYKNTNNMYSLYLAISSVYEKNETVDSFFINNADCLYDEDVIKNLKEFSRENAIAVKMNTYIEESMKITLNSSGAITHIAKTISPEDSAAVSIDLYKYGKTAIEKLYAIIKDFIEVKGDLKQWTEVAFPALFKDVNVYPYDIGSGKWVEVDNNDDLQSADKLFSKFDLKSKKCFVTDLDGTVYIGNTAISSAVNFIKQMSNSIDFYYLTNNTSKTPAEYVKKLKSFGVDVSESQILSPLYPLISFIKSRGYKSLYLLANENVKKFLKDKLPDVDFEYNEKSNKALVLTYDTEINFEKLKNACSLLNNRPVEFIATHSDVFCPSENGKIPDIGSMLALIKATNGYEPTIFLGKPNTLLLHDLINKYGAEHMVFSGDRLYTDKKLADNAGIDFVCVLSGDTTRSDVATDNSKFPAIIVPNLGELL